jgi:hypothetical protein
MAQTPAERRRAQRETARAVHDRRTRLPSAINRGYQQGRRDYADRVIAGREPMPEMGTREAKNLASLAGKARWGKADPRYEKAFSQFWYHKDEPAEEPESED